jgi:hypothetical protein
MELSVATGITLATRKATEPESARFMGQHQGFAKAADEDRFPAPTPPLPCCRYTDTYSAREAGTKPI